MKVTLLKACAEDLDVVNAARVSLDKWHDAFELNDEPLIHWLMRERHGSPFEHAYFKFRVEAPIFVFREWQRHRVGHSYNEMSARYTELEPVFYAPMYYREQTGKPGAYEYHMLQLPPKRLAELDVALQHAYDTAWQTYKALLEQGVAKEQARAVLPVGTYSKMIWSCNPRSLMHFCGLRNAADAQDEIRVLAAQAEEALLQHMPVTHAAFIANDRRAP